MTSTSSATSTGLTTRVNFAPDVENDPDREPSATTGPTHSEDSFRLLARQMSDAARGSKKNSLSLLYDGGEEMNGRTLMMSSYLKAWTSGYQTTDGGQAPAVKKAKLGTLFGVYLPTVQHIFGVIMFLRLFWIVGTAGVLETFLMVSMCCLCTFLTSISMSAIATNGIVESGGAYFMISRNLGAEFGSAVGILFYLANAVACSMYLIGTTEVLLTYVAPNLPQVGSAEGRTLADATNNFRIYGTLILLLVFTFCVMGVRFVQFFAPISLSCVIVSILAIWAGAFAADVGRSPWVCMLGDRLIKMDRDNMNNITVLCTKNETGLLWPFYCRTSNETTVCDPYFVSNEAQVIPVIPGFRGDVITSVISNGFPVLYINANRSTDNAFPAYMAKNEAMPGQEGNSKIEVVQDISTTFFILLAIYFPSVTGIMTGSNMSGDLKDPQRSIPLGTLAAQLSTSFVYLSFVAVFGGTIERALLWDKYGESLGNSMIVAQLAWPSEWVLLIGCLTSTFGAGLQCLCSAPRLLQSIAKDDVIPFLSVFSVVTKRNEPLRALLFTTLISEAAVLIGTLDYIAPIVDFFFLMCYCFVNVACALQTLLKAPNWRPRFRFYHWSLSLLGALLCLFIMFASHWYYALVVLLLCASIYKYVEFKGAKKEWGDGLRGIALSTAQYSLLKIEDTYPHPKNWRPQLLVFVKMDKEGNICEQKMLDLAGNLKAGNGLTIVASLIIGDNSMSQVRKDICMLKAALKASMGQSKIRGFAQVLPCNSLSETFSALVLGAGIGGLRPNTVMVCWPSRWKTATIENDNDYWSLIDATHRVATVDMCLLVLKEIQFFPQPTERLSGNIDIWWIVKDGGLLILVPFLLKKHKVWRRCKLRVFAVAQISDNSVKMKKELEKCLYDLRISASVHIVEMPEYAITAYTYERTLIMEERTRLADQLLDLSNRSKAGLDRINFSASSPLQLSLSTKQQRNHEGDDIIVEESEDDESNKDSENDRFGAHKKYSYTFTPSELYNEIRARKVSTSSLGGRNIDHTKVKKMHTALKLNKVITESSADSQLVVINLPRPPRTRFGITNYLEYTEALTEGLKRVILVRGTGKEVITMYS